MAHWQMLLCGAAGGTMMSLVTFYRLVQAKNSWPWKIKNGPTISMYITIETIRIVVGAGVAWGLAATGQLGVLGAMIAGAGAPAIVDKWQNMAPRMTAFEESNSKNSSEASEGDEPNGMSISPGHPAVGEGGA
ncbi:hypothetical protein ACQFX6_19400 [Streptomyces sp. DSM 41987]|uniref:hypothetical protein n=1 Tax=Streptomyces TaxID=1883 RepID=UPI00361BBB9A